MDENRMIKILDENGMEKQVEVIAYFTLTLNNKDYLIYTENKTDDNGNVEVYTSEVVHKDDDVTELMGIDDDNVWAEIKKVMIEIAKDGE